LAQYQHWQRHLHDLGECEVKHGRRLHLFNLYKDNVGNPQVPEKLKGRKRWRQEGVAGRPISGPGWPKVALTVALLVTTIAVGVSSLIFSHRASRKIISTAAEPTGSVAVPIPEKSVAVLPFENLSDEKQNAYFTDGIQAKISPSEKAAIEKAPTADLAAFDLYERAKALWADVTDPLHAEEKLPQAAELLDEAVARDPQFLLAWCLLSRVHGALYWTGHD